MQKNVASQKLIVFAFDSTTNLPKTGDSANITAYVSIDYGSVTVLGDTSATEMDATNAKGYYLFDLTQGETNGNTLLFSAKSATSNIVVIGVPAVIQTVPSSFVVAPGSANALTVAGSNAATTFAGLTTGALSCTTITASGAVAFQSTFTVTTSTSLGALSCTTLTASGAVAFQSTFAVTTSTSLGALSCTTLTASGAVALQSTVTLASLTVTGAVAFQSTWTVTGAVAFSSTFATTGTTTFNALTVTNALTVSGTTTLTGAFTASNGSNNIVGIDAAKINGNATAAANLGIAYGGLEIGTAQSGGASTITIRAGAVGTTNYWANQSIYLTGGTGGGQTNKVVSSSGQTLTVETAWVVQPDNTTTYVCLGRIG